MLSSLTLEAVRLLSIVISAILVLYTAALRILFFLLPDSPTINRDFLEMDMRFNITLLFILIAIGWTISYKQKRLSWTNPLKLQWEELLSLIASAIFLSYFFTNSFSLFQSFRSLLFLVISIVFVFMLTQIVELFKSYDFGDIKTLRQHMDTAFTPVNIKKQASNLVIFGLILILVGYSLIVSIYAVHKSYSYRQVIKENLYIEAVTPRRTTYAYKVTLTGYNFGPEYNRQRQILQSSQGPVMTSFWSENKIEFTVPLNWKIGNVSLWVDRPNLHNERRTISSNVVHMSVLNRWDFFPTVYDHAPARIMKRVLRTVYLDYWNSLATTLSLPI